MLDAIRDRLDFAIVLQRHGRHLHPSFDTNCWLCLRTTQTRMHQTLLARGRTSTIDTLFTGDERASLRAIIRTTYAATP